MKPLSILTSVSMICGGVVGFALSSPGLVHTEDTSFPPNPLGVKRSPYGEVFAMAMQGPIDTYFHASNSNGHSCKNPGHCNHPNHGAKLKSDLAAPKDVNEQLRDFIDGMDAGLVERTNPRGASAAHKFYLRRGIEDKLRFAYSLDPSHYSNYNAYHFFLTEPQLGTRPELTPTAAKLAQDTINYCLAQRTDPRHALTAAAAAGNVIELMFNDRLVHPEKPNYTTKNMREVLQVMDQAIGLYSHLSNVWTESGQWENLSEPRLVEVKQRVKFVLKIRETQEAAIRRLEGLPDAQHTATSMNTGSLNR